MNDRQETEQDLHATSESIKEDARRLLEIEHQKTTLDATDPRVDDLSDQAVELAKRALAKTLVERELSRDLDARSSGQGGPAIDPAPG